MSREHWFRGNTHVHTSGSDGNSAPEVVAQWYYDHNYNFLTITDHNTFVDPKYVRLPDGKRKDFILIPGQEITDGRMVHTTAMNIGRMAAWQNDEEGQSHIIQFQVDETIKAGGMPILNHPNDRFAVIADDILPVRNLSLFEMINGRPFVRDFGDPEHPSTESIWDHLLTGGMRIFAVAADDAHDCREFSPKRANPGRGWVMVRAPRLDADSITLAMLKGDFYASTGVFLRACDRTPAVYSIEVDVSRTEAELASLPSPAGRQIGDGIEGVRIEFIGSGGAILETTEGEKSQFKIAESERYVRAKAIYTRKCRNGDGFEEYYAFGQPVFSQAERMAP